MALIASNLRLYLVTDPTHCAQAGVVETVQRAISGGVTMVQLRDKTATTIERITLARALMGVLKGTGVPLVINDDLDAAIASSADGAHIGQSDGSVRTARERIGTGRILGLSCETPERVIAAKDEPVDYLGLGPVFATGTKADHERPIGISGLQTMAAISDVPTVAIGGLNASNVGAVIGAGCDGLAIVSAICGQADPAAAASAFFPPTFEQHHD